MRFSRIVLRISGAFWIFIASMPLVRAETEKPVCLDAYRTVETVDPISVVETQSHALVPVNYEVTTPAIRSTGIVDAERKTRDIMKDVMGDVRVFFPDPNSKRSFKFFGDKIDRHNEFDGAFTREYGTAYNNMPRADLLVEGKMSAEKRHEILSEYIDRVCNSFLGDPRNLTKYANLLGRYDKKKILAAKERLEKLQKEPEQKELLIQALDRQLPDYARAYYSASPKAAAACKLYLGVVGAGCLLVGGFSVHELMQLHLADLALGPFIMSAIPYGLFRGIQELKGGGVMQTYLKWNRERAAKRHLLELRKDSGLAVVEQSWSDWTKGSQDLKKEVDSLHGRSGDTALAATKVNGFRLLNSMQMLTRLSREELPGGKSFESIFGKGSKPSTADFDQVIQSAARRQEQISVLESELAHIQKDILVHAPKEHAEFLKKAAQSLQPDEATAKAGIGQLPESLKDADTTFQTAYVQLQSVNQQLAVAKMARERLAEMEGLVRLNKSTYELGAKYNDYNVDRLKTQLTLYKGALDLLPK